MLRRFIFPSVFATFAVGTVIYASVWAAAPAYSSESSSDNTQLPSTSSTKAIPSATPQAQAVTASSQRSVAPSHAARTTPARTVETPGNSLSIPSIGFRAPIIEVGVTASNNIDVPLGLKVGHWSGSATPGTTGAAFLDGHVSGVFARLSSVKTGEIISVNYNDVTFRYRIVHRETVPLAAVDMDKALSVYGDGAEGLNIMTCAGTYMPSRGTYDHRLVVYTVRV